MVQCNIGWCYLNGVGCNQDYKKAMEWYAPRDHSKTVAHGATKRIDRPTARSAIHRKATSAPQRAAEPMLPTNAPSLPRAPPAGSPWPPPRASTRLRGAITTWCAASAQLRAAHRQAGPAMRTAPPNTHGRRAGMPVRDGRGPGGVGCAGDHVHVRAWGGRAGAQGGRELRPLLPPSPGRRPARLTPFLCRRLHAAPSSAREGALRAVYSISMYIHSTKIYACK